MKLIPNLSDIDRKAVLQAGIPARTLMENAGTRVAEAVMAQRKSPVGGVILCGPGNNGGDGFVCARKLHEVGFRQICVIYTGSAYKNETLTNFEALMALPITMIDARAQETLALVQLGRAGFVVDALFGSGLSRPVQGIEARLIAALNARRIEPNALNARRIESNALNARRIEPGALNAPKTEPGALNTQRPEASPPWVLAVDLPSGIDGATGQVLGCAVQADATLTLAAAKPGLYLYPGKAHAGAVSLADIGIPQTLLEEDGSPLRLITPDYAKSRLPSRPPDSHKYSFGHLLVIAGSRLMPGAAILCAEAAMSAGAGLVTLAAPSAVFEQAPLMPEIIRLPLPDAADLGPQSLSALQGALAAGKYNAVLLGPGLGMNPQTVTLVPQLLEHLARLDLPLIVDADGLNALASHGADGLTLPSQTIFTPHVGECHRLLGLERTTTEPDATDELPPPSLLSLAENTRTRWQATIVLKSATTLIAERDGLLWISPTGNPGMATAGSGDVLAGIIGAMAAQMQAQQCPIPDAAMLGVYLHGLAGDAAADTLTVYAMRASDVTAHLPKAFKRLLTD